jgi:hypothetical protein
MSRTIHVKRNYHENVSGNAVLITEDSVKYEEKKGKKKQKPDKRIVYVEGDYFENISGNAVVIKGSRTVIKEKKNDEKK